MVLFAVAQRKENKWCCSLSLKEKKWCCSLPKNSKKRKEMVLFFFCLFQEPLFFCCFASKNSKKRKENLFFLLFFLFLKQTLIFLKQINKTWFSETKEQPAVLETSSNEPLFSRNKHCVSSFSWNKTWSSLNRRTPLFFWNKRTASGSSETNHCFLETSIVFLLFLETKPGLLFSERFFRNEPSEFFKENKQKKTAFLNRRTEQPSWTEEQNRRRAVLETSSPYFLNRRTEQQAAALVLLLLLNKKCFLKNCLFQENKWCCSFLLLLVSRTALLFFCLFQEPLKQKKRTASFLVVK